MKLRPICIDFETLPILPRPDYPPAPTSFSLQMPEWRAPKFFAWGQKTGGNNTTKADAGRVLKAAYDARGAQTPLLFHNAKFDVDVAFEHFKLPVPAWHDFHDTMFLLFLDDPHQRSLGLKPSADRILGLKQEERDAVEQWILEHKKQLEAEFPEIVSQYDGIKPSTAGAFIGYAPGTVVGPYANGDIIRTLKIFKAKYEEICIERGMQEAYDRERRLMPILLANERKGIRVDLKRMEADQPKFEKAQKVADDWIRKTLKLPDLDINNDGDVGRALVERNQLKQINYTKTGRVSVSKKNMKLAHFKNQDLAAAYSYRQRLATVLETFLRPWQKYGATGWMCTNWNQVRQAKGAGMADTGGTRTGRPSSDTPNFLNMPKKMREGEASGFMMPKHLGDLPEPPKIRSYILPDEKGWVVGRRDFNQQELRVLAHFEDGALLQAYLENPRLDVHDFLMRKIIEDLGIDVDRYITKTLNFGYVYGQGLGSLAERLDRAVDEVKKFRNAQMAALPGLKKLSDSLKMRARLGQPIHTWGGREYYVEEPRYSEEKGRWLTFDYKLLNYLVQGSSADITKESIIRYDAVRKDGRFMLTVYDENDICGPKGAMKKEMLLLRECMMSIEVDVPLLSDGELGPTLGDLEDLKEPAADLSRWIN